MSRTKAFEDALAYAAQLHAKQKRKGPTPRISPTCLPSPRSCSNMAARRKRRSALCYTMRSRIGVGRQRSIRFGTAMASGSPGSSRHAPTLTNHRSHPGSVGKRAFVMRLRTEPFSVRLVVAADKLHNVRDVLRNYRIHGDDIWSHFKGGSDGTLWYYRACRDARRSRQPDEHR